jgi:hypothetical protein
VSFIHVLFNIQTENVIIGSKHKKLYTKLLFVEFTNYMMLHTVLLTPARKRQKFIFVQILICTVSTYKCLFNYFAYYFRRIAMQILLWVGTSPRKVSQVEHNLKPYLSLYICRKHRI